MRKLDPHVQANLDIQIKRDEMEEAVETILDDCVDAYIAAGGGVGTDYQEDRDQIKTVLITAYNLWGIGRVDK